jgi:hypothetical protein
VLDRRAHDARRGLGTQRQRVAVQLVLERVHLLLDDVGELADAAHEQRAVGSTIGHAHVAVAVLREHARAVSSKRCHRAASSSGSTSFMPRTACSCGREGAAGFAAGACAGAVVGSIMRSRDGLDGDRLPFAGASSGVPARRRTVART